MNDYVFMFDIGNVLLDFSLPTLQKQIAASAAADLAQIQAEWNNKAFIGVETGKIDPLDYFAQFSARIGLSWTFDQWLDLWENIFTINPFGHGLYLDLHKKGYPVAILSNIGPHQATAIEHRFPDLFKTAVDRFFSYDLGLHKPDPRIYHAVCQRLAKQPSQCVLLDDLPDNVNGAQDIGMHAMQFTAENHPAIKRFIRSFC